MQAFNFGSTRRRLFGLYLPAAAASRPPAGVVICPPFGHEYIRTHRTIRNLAMRLSEDGLHVLKFDYFGCGDSAGGADEGTLAQWQVDVSAAIDELKDMTGLPAVSLVGVRLGAALAALAAAKRRDIRTLILWDPVLRGASYLDELQSLQAEWLKTRPRVRGQAEVSPDAELIGFPLTPVLRDEFRAVDIMALPRWPARRIVTLATAGSEPDPLQRQLELLGVAAAVERIPFDCEWTRPTSVHLQLLANDVSSRIAGILADKGAA
jgi:pimeloyl-ACP methyl ester carboxylesterase